MKAPRFCEMSGNATRTSDTRQHIRNVGNYSPNERHDNTSETSETTLNKRHTVTSPKRRKRLTERAIHGNVSETSERLTERATHGNTSPKRRKRLTERETHGNTSPKTSGTTYRASDTRQHISETSGTTHRTSDLWQRISETSGTAHRTSDTRRHTSGDLHPHLLTVVLEENSCETQSCCSCCLGVRDLSDV
jgi:hypothetical protein